MTAIAVAPSVPEESATAATTPTAETPRAWRIASLAMLAGGFVAGARLAGGGAGRWLGPTAFGVAAGTVALVARASRRPPLEPSGRGLRPNHPGDAAVIERSLFAAAADGPFFSVVVAARDEATVVPRLIADVAAQDHRDAAGEPRFELIVIDDRSTDGTEVAVRLAADAAGIGAMTRVIRRSGEDLRDGKGAALAACQPDACRGDVVVVLDADARIDPTLLSTLAGYIDRGAAAITPRRRTLRAAASPLAQVQADEQTLDGEIQRARWSVGGCSEFRGNGIVVRRDLLASVGGWRAEALTEDLDLSSRVAAATGVRVAWALDAEVWEEPVETWSGLWRQRLRWAEGGLRRSLEHGPAVLRSEHLPLATRVDFAVYASQLLAPPVVLGALAGGAARGRPLAAGALLAGYLATLGAIAFDALRWEREVSGGPLRIGVRLRRAVLAGLFNTVWLAAMPVAMWRLATRRGPVRYDKMVHRGDGAG